MSLTYNPAAPYPHSFYQGEYNQPGIPRLKTVQTQPEQFLAQRPIFQNNQREIPQIKQQYLAPQNYLPQQPKLVKQYMSNPVWQPIQPYLSQTIYTPIQQKVQYSKNQLKPVMQMKNFDAQRMGSTSGHHYIPKYMEIRQQTQQHEPNVPPPPPRLYNSQQGIRQLDGPTLRQSQQEQHLIPNFDKWNVVQNDQGYQKHSVPVEKQQQLPNQCESILTYEYRVAESEVQMDAVSQIQDPDSAEFRQQFNDDELASTFIIVDNFIETEVQLRLDKIPSNILIKDVVQLALTMAKKSFIRPVSYIKLGKATKKLLPQMWTLKDLQDIYAQPISFIIEDQQI